MQPLLEMRTISKQYPNGTLANNQISLAVAGGEIHALVGENGAGKTTLMRILAGLEQPDGGAIYLDGAPTPIPNPQAAIRLGIGMVHQHFALVPEFTVAENIVLGIEPGRLGFKARRPMLEQVKQLMARYNLAVDPGARIDSLALGQRQRVEILKTLHRQARILILDEPSAVLTPQETADLFDALRTLASQGKTIILISHKLDEVKAIAARATVLRRGEALATVATADTSADELATLMVGRPVVTVTRPAPARGPAVLTVRDLTAGGAGRHDTLRAIAFTAYAGEILGIAGVEGSGQTALANVLAGLQPALSGQIDLAGTALLNQKPRRIRQAGLAYIPEDRLDNAVAVSASIADNVIVDHYADFTRYGWWLDAPASVRAVGELLGAFDIRAANASVTLGSLSGGNMQKVVLARELSREPRVVIAAQPTRGLDIRASEFVHKRLIQECERGAAVLLISSDLAEVLSLADRLAIMHRGEIVAILPNPRAVSETQVGRYMLGLERQSKAEMSMADEYSGTE